jgi:hypothetical protein
VKILINGQYAYETDLEDVQVSDEMVLPGSFTDMWSGIVTELEPDYNGPCRKAIGLSRRKAQVKAMHDALDKVEIRGWAAGDEIQKLCSDCGAERRFVVERINREGRPTSLATEACACGAAGRHIGLGSAESFRHFMIEPTGL